MNVNDIGDAEAVSEGADISIAQLTTSEATVTVSKIGKAIEISDEAILSGYGNVVEEASKQILTSINSGVEAALISNMSSNATLTYTIGASDDAADGIADALTLLGEDIDGDKVIVVSPALYGRLRKTDNWIPNTEVGAEMIIRGVVGMVHGCQVIVSNRMEGDDADSAYIVKPGALAIYYKRGTMVEFDRDPLAQMNYIIGSNIFAPYVYDKTKLVKITVEAEASV